MKRLIIVILLMPFWLGIVLLLWSKNPLFILVPLGVLALIFVLGFGFLYIVGEFRNRDDWDLLIRSVLHRLGFKVAPPKSLSQDIHLENEDDRHQH